MSARPWMAFPLPEVPVTLPRWIYLLPTGQRQRLFQLLALATGREQERAGRHLNADPSPESMSDASARASTVIEKLEIDQ